MADTDPTRETVEVLFESRPSLRPAALAALAVAVATAALAGGLFVGLDDAGTTVAGVVAVLGALLFVRYLGRLYVLSRTSYLVTEREIRREFSLFLVRSSREVPVHQLRGLHLSQTPLQRLLGYGSVEVLTTGTERSLGFLAFQSVPDPATRRDEIRALLRERAADGGRDARSRSADTASAAT
jgi:uncharacterized membrane protein YdbT with pleckstrin-like domain